MCPAFIAERPNYSRVSSRKIKPRPGVPDFIDELAAAGVPLGIATTGTRAWVEPLLAQLFGLQRFAVVMTGDEAPVLKPDPGAYQLALEGMGLLGRPGVVAVEDSRNGLVAAMAAGLPCAVVVNDCTREQDLAGAAVVLDAFGTTQRPAVVLADPYDLLPRGLSLDTLRGIVRNADRRWGRGSRPAATRRERQLGVRSE